jgi:hypothetical protein
MKKLAIALVAVAVVGIAVLWLKPHLDKQSKTSAQQSFLLQLEYHLEQNQKEKLVRDLNHQCAQRQKAGLLPGRVLVQLDATDNASPDVIWEVEYPAKDQLERESKNNQTLPALKDIVWKRQRLWLLVDGEPSSPLQSKIELSRNHYYPKDDLAEKVLSWRIHASNVRKNLGYRRGRVYKMMHQELHENTDHTKKAPLAMWELEYGARIDHRIEKKLVKTKTFQSVMAHMRTLISRFEQSTWRLSTKLEASK